MRILGISAFYHDSAAALLVDGRISRGRPGGALHAQEARPGFPSTPSAIVSRRVGSTLDDVDHVVFFEKPLVKFERLLETYLANAPAGFQSFRMAIAGLDQGEAVPEAGIGEGAEAVLRRAAKHRGEAALCRASPEPRRLRLLSLAVRGSGRADHRRRRRVGDDLGRHRPRHDARAVREIRWPHSLGLLYSAFTYYTGFKVNSGEYKVMGLAPYGEPQVRGPILETSSTSRRTARFWLDQSYFNYATGLTMTSRSSTTLFGGPPREPEAPLTQRDMDLAASVQAVTEEIMLRMTRDLARTTASRTCVSPAASRSTASPTARSCATAISSASGSSRRRATRAARSARRYAAHHQHAGAAARAERRARRHAGLLPRTRIRAGRDRAAALEGRRQVRRGRTTSAELYERTADALERGNAVGWFQGRMEFGPRALGARSILGDPRNPEMQKRPQSQDQVPRELPAIRAVGAARGRRATISSSTPTAPTCCSSPTCSATGAGAP